MEVGYLFGDVVFGTNVRAYLALEESKAPSIMAGSQHFRVGSFSIIILLLSRAIERMDLRIWPQS